MNRFKLAISAFWGIPAVLMMRLARTFLLIRICRIFSERIGHFTADVSEHIIRKNFPISKTLDMYYFGGVSNLQWELMARRSSLKVFGGWLGYIDRWNRLMPGGKLHSLKSSQTQSRDTEGLFEQFDGSIPFLESEDELGFAWLKSKGWKSGEPFICLLVRDSKFLEHMRILSLHGDYHDYRDSDIATYVTSMEWLASKGFWILRMGKLMDKPFQANSNQIIDYAFDPEKSDLLDIWLFANCAGIISTGTGLDQIAAIYRKPHLFINAMPLAKLHSWQNMIWVPKNLRWRKTTEPLSLNEYLEHNYQQLHDYHSNGIEIIDLTSTEILAAVQEFWLRLSGLDSYTRIERDLQDKFWGTLKSWSEFNSHHGVIHNKASVGKQWLANLSKVTAL